MPRLILSTIHLRINRTNVRIKIILIISKIIYYLKSLNSFFFVSWGHCRVTGSSIMVCPFRLPESLHSSEIFSIFFSCLPINACLSFLYLWTPAHWLYLPSYLSLHPDRNLSPILREFIWFMSFLSSSRIILTILSTFILIACPEKRIPWSLISFETHRYFLLLLYTSLVVRHFIISFMMKLNCYFVIKLQIFW